MASLSANKPAPLLPTTAPASTTTENRTSPGATGTVGATAADHAQISPVASRRIPAHLPHSLSHRGIFTPQNTPMDLPPLGLPSSTALGAGLSPMPAKGGSGVGAGGRPIGGNSILGRVPHAVTPGNTPSSLEKIGRRMATNLILGPAAQNGTGGGGRIAPSYERKFSAGLPDLNRRLTAQAQADTTPRFPNTFVSASPSLRAQHAFLGDKSNPKQTDWPTSFSDGTGSVESEQSEVKEGLAKGTGHGPVEDQK